MSKRVTETQTKWLGVAALTLALAALPFVVSASAGNSWVRVLDFALLYIMLALGLNIVVGFAGLLDLGYIAFYGVGAYLYALLSSPHLAMAFPSLAPGLEWPVWLPPPRTQNPQPRNRSHCPRPSRWRSQSRNPPPNPSRRPRHPARSCMRPRCRVPPRLRC